MKSSCFFSKLLVVMLCFAAAIFISASISYAVSVNISTGTGTNEGVEDQIGNWLIGSGEVAGGCLIQVIKTSDGSIHGIVNNPPNYLSASETLVATTAVGEGFPFEPNEGKFVIDIAAAQGDRIYIRAFNNFTVLSSTHYGNSEIHTVEAPVAETWNINGDDDIPAFQTDSPFDFMPPGPPTDLIATSEPNGDISLSWINTLFEENLAGTLWRFSNDDYPSDEADGEFLTFQPGATGEAGYYLHAGLIAGLTYYYSAFSSDEAGNYSTAATVSAVSIDTIPPTVESITLRDRTSGSTVYSNSLTISIEASLINGAVQMLISDESSDTGWIALANPAEFTLTAGEGLRTVYYMVRDSSLNESNITSETITIDTIPPGVGSIEVTGRAIGGADFTNELTVSIEAFNVSAEAAEMMISQSPDFSGAAWISFSNPTEFALTGADGIKTVYYKVRDAALNESPVRSDSITLDTTGPVGSITINSGDIATNETSVSLTLAAVDDWTPIFMKVSNLLNLSGAVWEPFSADRSWTLSAGEGTKTVYARFMDSGSNESSTYSDTIIYDITSPEITSIILRDRTSGSELYTNEYIVNVFLITNEATPFMMISDEATLAGASWQAFASPSEFTITIAGEGTKEVWARVMDIASNVSSVESAKIILDTIPPSVESVSPLPGATGEATSPTIYADFDDSLSPSSVIAANFKVRGSSSGIHAVSPSYDDIQKRVTFNQTGAFAWGETVICTIETGVLDKAGNPLASAYTWSFEIDTEPDISPPVISDFMIDGRIPKTGDIISARPVITARIWDMPGEDPGNIGRIELDINSSNVFTWVGGPDNFNSSTGDFTYTAQLTDGIYNITLRAFDKAPAPNSTEESISGLRVSTSVGLEGPLLNHPNPFSPLRGQKTYFGYTLLAPGEVQLDFMLYDIAGGLVWRRTLIQPGGYHTSVSWDGRSTFGGFVGNGIYILKLVHKNNVLGTCKVTVLDTR